MAYYGARDPVVKIQDLTEDTIRFTLSGTDCSMANTIRRMMIAEVPTMAIDLVEFEVNSCPLHDEFLAHRLGLIPLRCSGDGGVGFFNYSYECDCAAGCPKCTARLTLDVHNTSEDVMIVYSSDLRCEQVDFEAKVEAVNYSSAADAACGAAADEEPRGIAIAKLAKGQHLKLRCVAKKGTGRIHAKWSPVCVAVFRHVADIQLNQNRLDELTEEQKQEFVNACPHKVFAYNAARKEVTVANAEACVFCEESEKIAKTFSSDPDAEPVVVVKTIPGEFVFTVETNGSLRPEEVVTSALAELQEKLRFVQQEVMAADSRVDAVVDPMDAERSINGVPMV